MTTPGTMQQDWQQLADLTEETRRIALDFLQGLDARPVGAKHRALAPAPLPEDGVGAAGALQAFRADVLPHLSASAGPRFWGYVIGGTNPAALLGDWLVSAADQNASINGDSIASSLTARTLDLLGDLFRLPMGEGGFAGSFTAGAMGANHLAALTFRAWAGERLGIDVDADGMAGLGDVAIFAASPHITMLKALGLAGFGRKSIIPVGTLPGREAMDPAALDQALGASQARAKVVIASLGIVTTGDSEDIAAIAAIAKRYDAWLHVDGAFGLFARTSSRFNALSKGVELADSITSDGHKWLNVPYDCGFYFTRRLDLLERAAIMTAPYLATDDPAPVFCNRTLESSQRFRALPAWMTLQAYGRKGIAEMVERCCDLAARFAKGIEASPGLSLIAPQGLNIVAFRADFDRDQDDAPRQRDFLNAVNETGEVFLTPGRFAGRAGIRAAFSNWMTQEQDVDRVLAHLQRVRATFGGKTT